MSGIILPDDFEVLVFKKFRQGDRENDPDAAVAMQLFLKKAKENPLSFAAAQTHITDDTAIAAFIEKVRTIRQNRRDAELKAVEVIAYQKAKDELRPEVELISHAKSLAELPGFVKKIAGAMTVSLAIQSDMKEMLIGLRNENSGLRQELREERNKTDAYREKMQKTINDMQTQLDAAHLETKAARAETQEANKKLAKAEKRAEEAEEREAQTNKRTGRRFKTTVTLWVTGVIIGIATKLGWLDPLFPKREDQKIKPGVLAPTTALPPMEERKEEFIAPTRQEPEPPATDFITPNNESVSLSSSEAIPLQNDKLRGLCDP